MKTIISDCGMCYTKDVEVKHFSFYVSGSEGICLCQGCILDITEFIRTKKGERFKEYLRLLKEIHRGKNEN